MRKTSPEAVRDDFVLRLEELIGFHDDGFSSFKADKDRSMLTEHSLLAAAVAWEGFVSDIFIAYINRDATRFKQHLKTSFAEHIKTADRPKLVFDKFVREITFPAHFTKAEVTELTDSIGNNVTFPSFSELEKRASNWLVAEHASKFSKLTAQQKAVVNSVIALRNHIAHRSKRSLDAMNEALARGVLHPTGIKRLNNSISNVGAWLKAKPVGHDETRFAIIMRTLKEIAKTF